MVKENNYINIREVLSRILRNPIYHDLTIEAAAQYAIDFIGIFGFPNMYSHQECELHIQNYRAKLPCDLISIDQVKDIRSNMCLKSMTDSFMPNNRDNLKQRYTDMSFKTQGQIIYTSFSEGDILVAYKSIPVDDMGFPLLLDNSVFLKTLELYIKKEVSSDLFDQGKISAASLGHTETNYAWLAGQLTSEFTLPSISEMQSLQNMLSRSLQQNNEFMNGFNSVGNKEHLKIH